MCVGVLQQKQTDFDKNWYKLNVQMAKDVFVAKLTSTLKAFIHSVRAQNFFYN